MYGQGTTRSINAIFSIKSYLPFDVLPDWRAVRTLPLGEQLRRLRDPAVCRQLVAAEAGMKPKDNKLQGGGAATTDPRKRGAFTLEQAVKKMTHDNSLSWELHDRGVIR